MVLGKLQKLDDTVVTGFIDTEEEIGEILSEIDDVKTVQSTIEISARNLSNELKVSRRDNRAQNNSDRFCFRASRRNKKKQTTII